MSANVKSDFYRVSELILPINGVFVPVSNAAVGVGGLGILVRTVRPSSQVDGLQRASSGGVVVVMVEVGVSIHTTHPVQPVLGQVFVLEHKGRRHVTSDLWSVSVEGSKSKHDKSEKMKQIQESQI